MHLPLKLLFITLLAVQSTAFATLEWENKNLKLKAEAGIDKVSGVFRFTNAGDSNVTIKSVKPACGCTAASLDKKVYKPGESGEIKTDFSIGSRRGHQRKSITVLTEDNKSHSLILEVDIPELLLLQPTALVWRKNGAGDTKEVIIQRLTDSSVSIQISSPPKDAAFTYELKEEEPGKHWKFQVTPKDITTAGRVTFTLSATDDSGLSQTYHVFAYTK